MPPYLFSFRQAKTILDEELDYDYRLIEMQPGHTVRDANGRAYNRVTWLDKRKEMMQRWADIVSGLTNLQSNNPKT